jgi:hypothetical protein
MTTRGRSGAVSETWKPRCKERFIFAAVMTSRTSMRYKYDECRRRRNHQGRCVGEHYVWDPKALKKFEQRYSEELRANR